MVIYNKTQKQNRSLLKDVLLKHMETGYCHLKYQKIKDTIEIHICLTSLIKREGLNARFQTGPHFQKKFKVGFFFTFFFLTLSILHLPFLYVKNEAK